MRKNTMMRVASALLVAVLLSTCAISGTYAKYVTEGEASDSARVAKWGVEISAGGQLFGDTYKAVGDGNSITAWSDASAGTVNSGTQNEMVVAPGTKNDDGLTFGVSGSPEVKVAVDFVVTGSDIVLNAGTGYNNTTTATDTTDTFDLGSDYNPVVFKLWQSTYDSSTSNYKDYTEVTAAGDTLTEIANYLNTFVDFNTSYDPNTNLATEIGTFKITWAWAIDGNNAADTLLGDLAVDNTLTAAANYSLNTAFNVEISVTQVD